MCSGEGLEGNIRPFELVHHDDDEDDDDNGGGGNGVITCHFGFC